MTSRSLFFTLATLSLAVTAFAGQMDSHIYTAVRSESTLTGKAKTIVTAPNAEPYYLAGAQGPDVVGVIMPELDKISTGNSAGTETHYSPLKAHLALSILDNAKTNAERAYAIGWITHYLNDTYIHPVVNDYGGFYEVAPLHHKELEQLETLYVLTKYPSILTPTRTSQDYGSLVPRFTDFILAGLRKTFPQSSIYAKVTPEYFSKRFNEAGFWCSQAHSIFCGTASHPERKGVHEHMLGLVIPNMPSSEDFKSFLDAVEIADVSADPNKVTATVRIHDTKCYGRFLADWEVAANKAVAAAKGLSVNLSAYLNAPEGTKKQALRKTLLASVPNKNLDQPLADFSAAKAFPGDKSYSKPYYVCRFWPADSPSSVKEVSGRCDDLTIKSTRWAGSEDGEVELEIPVPDGIKHPYCYELKVATIGKDDFKRSDYEKRSWAADSGKSQLDVTALMKKISQIELTLTYLRLSNTNPQPERMFMDYSDNGSFAPVKSNDWQWNGRQFTMKLHAEKGDPATSPNNADIYTYDIEAQGEINAAGTRLETLSLFWKWERKLYPSWSDTSTLKQYVMTEKSCKLRDVPIKLVSDGTWQAVLSREDCVGRVLAASMKSNGYYISGDKQQSLGGMDDDYATDKFTVAGITLRLQANPKFPIQP